jgi:ABC-2 type transport system ATP-binding protein
MKNQLSEELLPAATSSSSPAIVSQSLSKIYSEGLFFGSTFQALKDVTFQVNQGEIFGLLGPNGAGKTTFIKILLGIIRKTSGQASLLGQPAGSIAGRQLVGYLPEHLRMAAHLTGYQALECYGNLSNVPTSVVRRKQDRLLELVGLAGRANDRCRKYSKGMLQRLGLAQALLHEPKLLILDEPTDGLDPQARAEMRQIIRRLKEEGVTIFLNSHLLQEVEMICDRVAILDRGSLRYSGSVSEIGDFVKRFSGNQGTEIRLQLEISGSPEQYAAALRGLTYAAQPKGIPGGNSGITLVKLTVQSQQQVDSLLDELRRQGVSIYGLLREQVTLEDAFLRLVSQDSDIDLVDQRMANLMK